MKNLPSIKVYPFLPKVFFVALSFLILDSPAFCGGWKSIGPTTGANAHIRSFAISSFTHKMYATTDSGLARREQDSIWSMLRWSRCYPFPWDQCEYYNSVWSHPLIDSVWFLGWNVSFFESAPTLSFATSPENQWTYSWVSMTFPIIFSLRFHPSIPAKLYSNNQGFCVSNDTGKTWKCQDDPTFWPWVEIIGIDEKLSEKVYAYGVIHRDSISGLYRTTDEGNTWSYASSLDPYVLLAYNDTLIALSQNSTGVILSTDAGSSWNQVLSENVSSVVRHPKHSNVLFAGTSGIIYRSTNGGGNWDLYNTTLPAFRITQLGFDGTSDTLYVGTDGGGIIQVYDFSVGVDEHPSEIPTKFKLFPAYPNPFNPTTTIAFELPQRAELRLEIFNVVGQKMTTIFNGIKEAGRYSMPLREDGWSSGVYLLRMIAGRKVSTQSIILMK